MPTRRRFLLYAAATAAVPSALPQAQTVSPSPAVPGPIAALPNRAHEATPITLAERQARADKARTLMQQQGMAAIILTGGTSLVYFTGIHSGQSERLFAWVLPADQKAAPYIVCPSFEEARMSEQLAQIPDGASTKIYTWQEDEDPYRLLVQHLPSGGGGGASNIGVASSVGIDERVQFVFANSLAKADPWRKFISAIPVIAGCRQIKSPAELALMQLANAITLAVYKAAWQAARPGITNHDFSALVAEGYRQSGVQGDASCQVGPSSALPHGSLQPQVIREGQIILIDDGCTVQGYQSDISRTFVYGTPTQRQKDVFEIVHRAQAAALAAARPGIEAQAIDAAARQAITAAGFGPGYRTFTHRLGHGIGMDGHEWPYLVRGNTTLLQPGMCFSDEPGIYLPGEFGIRLEDDWHLTDHGGVLFTPQSPSLEQPFA